MLVNMNASQNFTISKNKTLIFLCISILLVSTIFGSLKFLPLILLFLYKEIFKNITSLFVFLIFSPLLLLTSFSNFSYFVVFILFIVLFSSKFHNSSKNVYHIYLNMMIPFLLVLPFFAQYEGNTYSVLTFGNRLFPIIPSINQSINPNTIAIIAAVCSVLAILNKRYYVFVLRDDILVNQVACPTKIVEYLNYGIIPIVLSENIGDFKELGYEYLSINDFNHNVAKRKSLNNTEVVKLIYAKNNINLRNFIFS